MSAEELVSAERRKFLVAIQPAGLFRDPKPQVLIVEAYSENQARIKAVMKVAQGKYKNRTPKMWQITSVEPV